ncbi:hypothetical protein DICPUDRAFT_153957 [Dictyostelium purpureum]|uniref:Uncharacterized protein n=1 Tax=Dictyostelium purpureum TaxID=5786 RepID=F0ZQ67_DICPU|nr:uncharacterized protein DICPUDRAFT_153957 [Dictyostelium purpureum]EGC33917.1 hypothetical protein DICPUDRAFT_153957 [Dictyostelium purpureum]|eukprot:XP_003289552.1 hypothetical protein DICPUDRAFT_153957 [Dictyostelium purpureum]
MNNSSNNDNNYDEKTSKVFYLVFHNKFLFNKIFNFIHSVEFIKYNSLNDVQNERFIFKNITSLKFLLEKKLYHLLKYKLESDEYIHVDSKIDFIKMISSHRDLAKEIFKLFLQSTLFGNLNESNNIFYVSLEMFDEDFIQNILNGPNSHPVLPSMLLYFFEFSTNSKIKIVLDSFYNINKNNNSNNINNNNNNNNNENKKTLQINNNISKTLTFQNEYKNEIISNIYHYSQFKDCFQRDRVLQLVLSNKEYYNIHNNNKIDIVDIVFKTISIENQNNLLDLKLYFLPSYVSKNNQLFIEIDDIIDNNKDNNRIIKLSEYIINNFIILGGCTHNYSRFLEIKQYPFDYFSHKKSIKLEDLKLLLQNNTNNWKKIKDHNHSPSFYEIDLESIKFYFENEKHLYFIESDIWEAIGYSIKNYKENKKPIGATTTLLVVKDKQTVDLISEIMGLYKRTIPEYVNKFPGPRFSILDIMGSSGHYPPKIDENTFKFNSLELLKYTDENIFTLANLNVFGQPLKNAIQIKLIEDAVLEIPLKNAIEAFNLEELKSIFELIKDYSLSRLYYSYKKPNRPLSDQDITQITETIEYFIKINCPQGVYYCLDLMPEGYYEHTEKDIPLTNLFNNCEVLTTVFAISVKLLSVHIIKLLINKYHYNADLENKLSNYTSSFFEVEKLKTNKNPHTPWLFYNYHNKKIDFQTQRYDNINIYDVISIIHLIISKSKQLQNKKGQQSISNINENYIFTPIPKVNIYQGEALMILINKLFKILIQSKGEVPFEKIKSTYRFINSSGVTTVQKSALFSIYYLANKSLILTKYLFGLSMFEVLNYSENVFNCEDLEILVKRLEDLIDPEVFSFEYIFGNNRCIYCDNGASCGDIIEKLHQNIFNKLHTIYKRPPLLFISNLCFRTVKTLLYLQRYDLFLKYLEELKLRNIGINGIIDPSFINLANIFKTGDNTLISTLLNGYSIYCIFTIEGVQDLLKYNIENNTNIGQSLIKKEIHTIYDKNFHSDSILALHHLIFGDNSEIKFSFIIELYKIPFKLYHFLLNTYPNNALLKPSKKLINEAIHKDFIVFLKKLYQNDLINDDIDNTNDEYNQLLSHLKQKLSENLKCKYINWFN